MDDLACDIVIFGGGAAGLWLLDELTRRGHSALLIEKNALGAGQTIAAQGILHSGLKYSLNGLLTPAAREARDMPAVWRDCLRGATEPDLAAVRLRSDHCYLWRTHSLSSRLGMFGACVGLRVNPELVPPEDVPSLFRHCPGPLARVAEPVLSLQSLLATLAARNVSRILRLDPEGCVDFDLVRPGVVRWLALHSPEGGRSVRIRLPKLVLAAGAGNESLRARLGLERPAMQLRPLHMLLVRGNLPACFGHCIDGAATRVTITSDSDSEGRTVWQIGGQLSETGVHLDPQSLVAQGHKELLAVLPGVDLTGTEWAAFRIDRAEGATPGGARPDSIRVLTEGKTTTVWPTKLVLVPQLARAVRLELESGARKDSGRGWDPATLADWPRPAIALPPWERPMDWQRLTASGAQRGAA